MILQGGAGDTATTTDVVVEAGIDEVTETGKEQGEDGDGDDLDNFLHEFSMESSTATKERDESSAMPAEVLHLGKSVKSPGEKLDAPSSRAAKIESIVGQIPQSNAGNVKAIAVQLVREAMRKAGANLSHREGNNDANSSQGDAEAVQSTAAKIKAISGRCRSCCRSIGYRRAKQRNQRNRE